MSKPGSHYEIYENLSDKSTANNHEFNKHLWPIIKKWFSGTFPYYNKSTEMVLILN